MRVLLKAKASRSRIRAIDWLKMSKTHILGRGKQVIAVARTADLVVMQLDALKGPYQADQLTAELEAVGIRLNQAPPDIYFKQKKGGGLGTVQFLRF